jgi:hypothetical protein
MKTRTKAYLITFLIAVSIYLFVIFILQFIFHVTNLTLVIIIGSALTAFLSPKQQIIEKQSGKELQLKWRFSKNGLLFKSKL